MKKVEKITVAEQKVSTGKRSRTRLKNEYNYLCSKKLAKKMLNDLVINETQYHNMIKLIAKTYRPDIKDLL